MTLTIGVGIAHDAVSLVVASGRRVVWHGEQPAGDGHGAAFARLFEQLPKKFGARGRTSVRIAIGPANCQIKPLVSIPSKATPLAVSQIVLTGVERFFLRNGHPLVTTDAERRGDAWWAAAFPKPLIDEMRTAVERCGLSVSEFVPGAGILVGVLEGERLIWPDGQVLAEVEVSNGTWISLRRRRRPEAGGDAVGRPTPGLAALDHGDLRWAQAYAAATSRGSTRIALRPGSAQAARRRAKAVRGLAMTAVLVAAASVISIPGFAAWYTGAKATRVLDSLQTAAAQIARVNYELQRVSAQESEVAQFAASRRSFTELLGALSTAMPESTAMTSFHADSAGGTAILLSPAGAEVLGTLSSVPRIAAPQIVGAISRQTTNGAALQRIALRFRFPGQEPHAQRRRASGSRAPESQ